jgi:hypothetical protein
VTRRKRDEVERALEQLDDTRAIAEIARPTAVAATPLAQVQARLEQATREVWQALKTAAA